MMMKLNVVAQERFTEARKNNTATGRADARFTAAIGLRREIAEVMRAHPGEDQAADRCEAYLKIAEKHDIDLEQVEATTVQDIKANMAGDSGCTVEDVAKMLSEGAQIYSKLYAAEAMTAEEFRAASTELAEAGQLLNTDIDEACRQVTELYAKAKKAAGE